MRLKDVSLVAVYIGGEGVFLSFYRSFRLIEWTPYAVKRLFSVNTLDSVCVCVCVVRKVNAASRLLTLSSMGSCYIPAFFPSIPIYTHAVVVFINALTIK